MEKIPVIVIGGATASGKTGLAIELANHIGGEIVNADSMQIYRFMDIGTAKPTASERRMAEHHLIDFVNPDEQFSVADYTRMAHEVIAGIASRGRTAVISGGTGLYINSVVDDVEFGEIDTDFELRDKLNALAKEKGNEFMLEMLSEFDPVSASRLHPNNLKRVIRAIEFYKLTGTPISEHQEETKKKESRYDPLMMCVDWSRETLYGRINRRVDTMLEEGLEDEVRRLREMGYSKELNSMQAIGYKEMYDYLDGKYSIEDAADAIKQGSRRYAKRQLTWFRRDKRIHWLPGDSAVSDAKALADKFLR